MITLTLAGIGKSNIERSVAFSILRSEYFIDIEVIPSAMLMVISPAIELWVS
jgi:hypothetical protein